MTQLTTNGRAVRQALPGHRRHPRLHAIHESALDEPGPRPGRGGETARCGHRRRPQPHAARHQGDAAFFYVGRRAPRGRRGRDCSSTSWLCTGRPPRLPARDRDTQQVPLRGVPSDRRPWVRHICDLAAHATYEEAAYLLLMGELPTQQELERFQGERVRRRPVPEARGNVLAAVAQQPTKPMAGAPHRGLRFGQNLDPRAEQRPSDRSSAGRPLPGRSRPPPAPACGGPAPPGSAPAPAGWAARP